MRTISFQPKDCNSNPLFEKQNLLKFEDKSELQNVLLVSKYFNNIALSIFNNWFTLCSDIHNYNTAASSTGKLFKPSFRKNLYGKNSIIISAFNRRNKLQTQIKTLLTKKCIETYYYYYYY